MWSLLFIVGIFSDGNIRGMAIGVYQDGTECEARAKSVNEMPNTLPLKWSKASCVLIPNPREVLERKEM
jgi:hypothetical protein